MSQEQVNAVIGRAATDTEFRNLLKTDTETALSEYELTDEETESLKKMNFETLDAFAGELDDRISKRLRHVTVGG